jgi:hypothetical protein
MKLQPTILPPDTVQVSGEEETKPVEAETDVSPVQPDPVTVTIVPGGPELGENETIGIPTLRLALIDGPGIT